MKKVLFLIFFFICSLAVLAQYPQPYQNLGSRNVVVRDTAGLFVRETFVAPIYPDTLTANLNLYTRLYTGSIIYTTDVKAYWFRQNDPAKWVLMGSSNGNNNKDTIFTRLPLYVDTTSQPGRRILSILHANGLESGGVVTRASCLTLDVTSPVYDIGYKQYTAPSTTLIVPPADPSFPRTDEVIADTFGVVSLLVGVPSSTPAPVSINPSSQLVLATYTIGAGASCVGIIAEVIYDENLGSPAEWDATQGGTMTLDYDNTDNPYHLTKAAFASTYTDGSSFIFTRTGNDTAQVNEILKLFIYLNGAFSNQFQFQFYLDGVPVGSAVAFNTGYGFNPLDSNEYQNVSIPFSAFNLTNQIFNKLVITMAGNDLSGAKGYYIDYIQLQTGINNFSFGKEVLNYSKNAGNDSTILLLKDGTRFAASDNSGSGAETWQQTLDNGKILDKDNKVRGLGNTFSIDSTSFVVSTRPIESGISLPVSYFSLNPTGIVGVYVDSLSNSGTFSVSPAGATLSGGNLNSGLSQINVNGTTINIAANPIGFGYGVTFPNTPYTPSVTPTRFAYLDNDTLKVTDIGGSGGNTNTNIGAGYRWAVPNTNDIKTIFGGLWVNLDSTSNTNGITVLFDSAAASSYYLRRTDSTVYTTVYQNSLDWHIRGNSNINSGQNFLGTTTNNSVPFRTNNIERMRVDSVGNVGIGYGGKLPTSHLHIIDSLTIASRGLAIEQNSNNHTSNGIFNFKSRNTYDAKTDVQAGDYVGGLDFFPYINGGYGNPKIIFGGVVKDTPTATTAATDLYIAMNKSGIASADPINAGDVKFFLNTKGTLGLGPNNINPDSSAVADFKDTTRGFLMPRMTTTLRNAIVLPATGLIIYNTSTGAFNWWNGAAWVAVGSGTGTGTVTSVGLTSSDITVGGASPITTSGTYTLTLPTVNGNVGTFTNATVTANAKGQITAISSGAAGGTTDYQYQTAAGSTTLTFTSVPSALNDFEMFVNGARIRQTTDYTKSGNDITIPSLISGDQVVFQRLK